MPRRGSCSGFYVQQNTYNRDNSSNSKDRMQLKSNHNRENNKQCRVEFYWRSPENHTLIQLATRKSKNVKRLMLSDIILNLLAISWC